MATKVVGVRELKNRAPALVQRAERGEEFVVTRHGRAVAVLGPPALAPAVSAGRRRLLEWERERKAFESMERDLERKYSGKFVAVREGNVIDSDRDPHALFARVARVLGQRAFFIGRVGEPEPMVDMPGFSIE